MLSTHGIAGLFHEHTCAGSWTGHLYCSWSWDGTKKLIWNVGKQVWIIFFWPAIWDCCHLSWFMHILVQYWTYTLPYSHRLVVKGISEWKFTKQSSVQALGKFSKLNDSWRCISVYSQCCLRCALTSKPRTLKSNLKYVKLRRLNFRLKVKCSRFFWLIDRMPS